MTSWYALLYLVYAADKQVETIDVFIVHTNVPEDILYDIQLQLHQLQLLRPSTSRPGCGTRLSVRVCSDGSTQ